MEMIESFLDWPEDPIDWDDLDYSDIVGQHLRGIYQLPTPDRYIQSLGLLERLLALPMGLRQRVRLRYILGMSHQHARQGEQAANHFDHALAATQLAQDAAAFAVLALQQAHLHYLYYSKVSAKTFAQEACEAFESLVDSHLGSVALTPGALDFGLMLYWELATTAFYLEDYQEALLLLDRARRLARQSSERHHREASVAWTAALVYRWLQRPIAALAAAREAVALYRQHRFGSEEEQARMNVVFAEVAMDTAQHVSPDQDDLEGTVAQHLIEEAGRCVQAGLADLARLNDTLGFARAQLIQARHGRLANTDIDRWLHYEQVEALGLAIRDQPLLCQMWIERGNDLDHRGMRPAALMCYQSALDALGASDVSAIGAPARRALLEAQR